jgi:hypothetical protein
MTASDCRGSSAAASKATDSPQLLVLVRQFNAAYFNRCSASRLITAVGTGTAIQLCLLFLFFSTGALPSDALQLLVLVRHFNSAYFNRCSASRLTAAVGSDQHVNVTLPTRTSTVTAPTATNWVKTKQSKPKLWLRATLVRQHRDKQWISFSIS